MDSSRLASYPGPWESLLERKSRSLERLRCSIWVGSRRSCSAPPLPCHAFANNNRASLRCWWEPGSWSCGAWSCEESIATANSCQTFLIDLWTLAVLLVHDQTTMWNSVHRYCHQRLTIRNEWLFILSTIWAVVDVCATQTKNPYRVYQLWNVQNAKIQDKKSI